MMISAIVLTTQMNLEHPVNDSICYYCDGCDEYDGKVKCPNTCWEDGKVVRDRLMKKISTYKEGITLREREIEVTKVDIAKDEVEPAKLKNEEKSLKDIVEHLKEFFSEKNKR
ncbi:hypothetical protein F3Y22_tig00117032pilonHSYRG00164 [Hibiscus syriacus]|uniref:Uncharacterized protein n=1 Tax=Hibiscus syriacus TaxID=106335 RepID=A0A6A2WCB0_HIBSY|nr:hypothetical protein F3Y22_tig00117032pilonHSYRG00164 [Hibiscus syriacus]